MVRDKAKINEKDGEQGPAKGLGLDLGQHKAGREF